MAPAWRYLVAALVVAEAAHEKYVIQAFDPAHAGAIDAKPPDAFSTIELTPGADGSTRASYSVARNGRRKGVAQMTRMRPMNCAGAEALSMLKTRARSVSLSTSHTSTSHGSHGSRYSRHASSSLRSAKTSPSVGRKSFRHSRSG